MLADQILDRKGRNVATIEPQALVADALQILATNNVGALIVSPDGTQVAGILSERDIVRRLASDGASVLQASVDSLAQSDVITCGGHTHTEELMNLMTSRRIRHLPIVDDGRLTGIISIGDVVKTRIDELANEREQLVGYIQHGR